VLLVAVARRRAEARPDRLKIVALRDLEPDPAVWRQNFPREFDGWARSGRPPAVRYARVGVYGGPDAFSRLERHPEWRRLLAGSPYAQDWNEDAGHALSLDDLLRSRRHGADKPGACLSCKSADVPRLLRDLGAAGMNRAPLADLVAQQEVRRAVACADCHDAQTAGLRITRPWLRDALRARDVDVDEASRQELRSYVCAQCHAEYYLDGPDKTVVLPWTRGLILDEVETYYDVARFSDWTAPGTGVALVALQHPDFEVWRTGPHARAGVGCADCHMPYRSDGAAKTSAHEARSPLFAVASACGTCHRRGDAELRAAVLETQERTSALLARAQAALVDAHDTLRAAVAAGADDALLDAPRALYRRAHFRWSWVAAENSTGFHSPQETARLLGEAIDFARQAQLAAARALGPGASAGGR
jgi:nitrite reductase (cytochrome c-552)